MDQFVTELCKQVKDCEFGSLKDDLMMHVLIRGVDSDRMRRKLLEAENLDLAKAIRLCQITESANTSRAEHRHQLQGRSGCHQFHV